MTHPEGNTVIVSFYRYTVIDCPMCLRVELQEYCYNQGILGRILIATEGINGAVCASHETIFTLKGHLTSLFPGMIFQEEQGYQSYHKLVVRTRNEIVSFGHSVDMTKAAPYIEPEELQMLYNNTKKFILLDVRNSYETEVGKFDTALTVPIQNFREFPSSIPTMDKTTPIITYCTGGIRCEKATAFMIEQGFTNVRQLHGGIIAYVNKYPNSKFKGSNFVFDDRLVSSANVASPISECKHCKVKSDHYINCYNIHCDKLFICCPHCSDSMNGSCSVPCTLAPERRIAIVRRKNIGKILHYYNKARVAYGEFYGLVRVGMEVRILGKTTDSLQRIHELHEHEPQRFSFPVDGKVRPNDCILIENIVR